MKAIEILKNLKNEMQNNDGIINWDCSYEYFKKVDNAIEEIENLQNENKSLVKTLEKMNEEMLKLRKPRTITRKLNESSNSTNKRFKKPICNENW